MEIGDRIRARREELGISQEELAKAIGYKSRSSINKIEIDGRGLPQDKIMLIAKALRVTPSYLMGWAENDEEAVRRREASELVDFLVKDEDTFLLVERMSKDENFRERIVKMLELMEGAAR